MVRVAEALLLNDAYDTADGSLHAERGVAGNGSDIHGAAQGSETRGKSLKRDLFSSFD